MDKLKADLKLAGEQLKRDADGHPVLGIVAAVMFVWAYGLAFLMLTGMVR